VEVPASAPASVAPIPAHVAAVMALYGDALRVLLAGREGEEDEEEAGAPASEDGVGEGEAPHARATLDLLRDMLARVSHQAEEPPRQVEGVSDAFLEGLERVGRGRLRGEDKCPICGERFLDGEFFV
jgi:hypothetical protein